jgi:hypothetical protein
MGWATEVQFPDGARDLCLLHSFQTGSEPTQSLSSGNGESLSGGGERGWFVKLTTHLHLVPRLIMHGTVPPLRHTSIWPYA